METVTETPAAATAPAPAAATAPAPAATENSNTFLFAIPNTDKQMQIDRTAIPAELRLELLDKAIEGYVRNSVNVANVRYNKDNEAWAAYNAATAADPLQTAVAKPEGDAPTEEGRVALLIQTAADARTRLYENKVVRRDGSGGGSKTKVDPLTKLVTDAVVRELYEKEPKGGRTFVQINAEVSKVGGVAYLEARIAEKVAAGADEKELRKYLDSRYITPAKLMLGQSTTKATSGEGLL